MSVDDELRAAHEAFYAALNQTARGDASAMAGVWSHSPRATCAHPMGHWVYGWEQIWTTWVELATVLSDGQIHVRDLQVRVYGDLAYTTCTEDTTLCFGDISVHAVINANATHIYVREPDGWKLVHRHADKSVAAEYAIDRLASD